MKTTDVERLETAPAYRRAVEVWYAVFGGVFVWMLHLLFVVAAEHWTHLHPQFGWTLHAATGVCAVATLAAILLSRRLLVASSGHDPSSVDDAGQIRFLAQVGLLIGAISLALILLEGTYAVFIPRG